MSTLAKVFAVLVLVLSVGFAAVTAVMYATESHWKTEYAKSEKARRDIKKQLQAQIDKLSDEKERLLSTVQKLRELNDKFTDDNRRLTDELRALKESLKEKTDNYNNLQNNFSRLSKNLEDVMNELKQQKEIAKSLRENIEELRRQNKKLASERDSLAFRLQTTTATLDELKGRFNAQSEELKRANELLEIAKGMGFKPQDARKKGKVVLPTTPIRGRVTAVDPKIGLVVINVGSQDKVEERFPFIVYRGAEFVAKIVVDQVFPEMSVARVEIAKASIQIGDNVTTRLASF